MATARATKEKPTRAKSPPPTPPSEAAAAVWVATDTLVPWVDNPRLNDPAVDAVCRSIQNFGWGAPLLARRENGELIAGHTRLRAALKLGMQTVPVRFLDLDPAQAHLLALADNKLNEIAEWDDKALAKLLNEFSMDDVGIAGWDEKELERLATGLMDVDSIPPHHTRPDGQVANMDDEEYANASIKQVVLYFEADEYDRVVAQLQAIQDAHGLDSNTEAILFLLDRHGVQPPAPAGAEAHAAAADDAAL